MMPIRWPFASNLLLPAESKNGRGMDWNHRRRYTITLKFTHTHAMDRDSLRENYWGLSWFVAVTCTDASNMGMYFIVSPPSQAKIHISHTDCHLKHCFMVAIR